MSRSIILDKITQPFDIFHQKNSQRKLFQLKCQLYQTILNVSTTFSTYTQYTNLQFSHFQGHLRPKESQKVRIQVRFFSYKRPFLLVLIIAFLSQIKKIQKFVLKFLSFGKISTPKLGCANEDLWGLCANSQSIIELSVLQL